jgi:hypothetical protein
VPVIRIALRNPESAHVFRSVLILPWERTYLVARGVPPGALMQLCLEIASMPRAFDRFLHL